MSSFFPEFKATRIAAAAFMGDFATKPYYNVSFHLDSIVSLICHVLRLACDLTAFALRVAVTPLCILNPLAWLGLPTHLLEIVDDAVGSIISAATVPVAVICMTLRTLHSLFGYGEGNGCQDEEQSDLDCVRKTQEFLPF